MGKPPEQEPTNISAFRKEAKPFTGRLKSALKGREFYRRVKEDLGLEPDQLMELLAARAEEPEIRFL